jgi:hypothetical protein
VSLFYNSRSKEGYHSFENIDPWSWCLCMNYFVY